MTTLTLCQRAGSSALGRLQKFLQSAFLDKAISLGQGGKIMAKTLAQTPLSVLDLVTFRKGKTIADAFENTRNLSQKAEAWGYQRYWMAEHHNLEGIASAATPILIGHVAGLTKRIRVGSGGIMLPNHSPLVVAEQFGTLETLYPGRIDLGLGRAPGTDQSTMRALRRNFDARENDFGDLVTELKAYFAPAQPGQKIKAIPGAGISLPIWILGSSLYSAQLAARMGLPYSFAGHFAPQEMLRAFALYRDEFQPSEVLSEPKVMVGVQVVAADDDEKAKFQSTTVYRRFLGIVRGTRGQGSEPVQSMDGLWEPAEERIVRSMTSTMVIGGPATLKKSLQNLIDQTQADELIIMSDLFEQSDRLRSYELIAQAAGML